MNNLMKSAVFASALMLAGPALAKQLSVTVSLKSYRGDKAYAVAYIVDPKGKYVSTVHAAGKKNKYLNDMKRWYRMMKRSKQGIDGTTGASVGSGRQFKTRVEIPDEIFDAGYTLRVATVVEDRRYYKNDARIVLSQKNNNKSVAGSGYVNKLTIKY